METNLTRRGFLTGAATTGALAAFGALAGCAPAAPQAASNGGDLAQTGEAATAGWSWETAPAPIADGDIVATVESDIVIVGAGLAGVTAACRATELGASVTVVEKMPFPSSRGGHYAAYQSRAMTEAGMTNDPKDEIVADWMRFSGNRTKEELAWLFMDRSSEVMDWLDDLSGDALNIIPIYTHYAGPQYYEHIGTHVIRGDFPDNENKISAPVYFMWKRAESQGASFVFDTPAEQLMKEGDRVTAVIAKGADGYVKYVGTKAVVLATGDISGDPEMIEAYGDKLGLKPVVNAYTPEGANTGDGQKMGMWVGGRMQEYPVPTMIHLIRYCGLSFGFMYVNQEGRRFMNEDTWIQAKSIRIMEQPGGEFAWSVFDKNWADDVARSIPLAGGQFWDDMSRTTPEWTPESATKVIEGALEAGNAVTADTLEELAAAMGVDEVTFLAEVENYNALHAAGEDTQFHKRAELLSAIKEPPFYALKFGPSLLAMPGGLEINEKLQVLGENDEPIEGLYAIGNASGGRYALDYPVFINGNSHGSAMTWGYVAAENIVNG
ncbi:FAD-dependent oxidoreductase [Adlercreutzia mucosicola]|uniref:FAD-dependent oxidoreductase n=1 Tax=Adlercreutzia mucosicola TaxID=580026 RepID=UPI002B24CAF1|nr:FAD-dependent oxidoreductase [Adlercreutzia mucosicola]MEB1813291.1 FAD-binding protein [Adlercreutzia mucosicola]